MSNANLSALALAEQNVIVPLLNPGTLGFSLNNASTPILTANAQTQRLTFHNPGTVAIYVCQSTDMNGNALTAGPNAGNWIIEPAATLTFTGNGVAGAWLAAAATGSGNPLTVLLSQTL
jgi:hypothetical protein